MQSDKHCPRCNATKPLAEFVVQRSRNNRPKSHCKACCTETAKAWRHRNPDYEKNRYQKIKVETRERHLVRKYGVSLADYQRMSVTQDGKCAICSRPECDQPHGVFHVDHCHETGRVRGLLCTGCNHMLGAMRDDVALLRRAIDYLSVPQVVAEIGRAILAAERLAA